MTETVVQPDLKIMPMEIRRAVGALWLSLLLNFIVTVIDWGHVSRYRLGCAVFVQIFPIICLALLIWKIGQGRSWARTILLVLLVGGGLITVLFTMYSRTFRDEVFRSTYSAGFFAIQSTIQIYATVLLFTAKARDWFVRTAS